MSGIFVHTYANWIRRVGLRPCPDLSTILISMLAPMLLCVIACVFVCVCLSEIVVRLSACIIASEFVLCVERACDYILSS